MALNEQIDVPAEGILELAIRLGVLGKRVYATPGL
jgi:hypothetical protein